MSINIWGSNGNAAFAVPMEQATPDIPTTQAYVLAWDPVQQLLAYVPVNVDAVSGDITPAGNITMPAGKKLYSVGNPVVGERRTGWTAPTGTTSRATFDTATVTTAELAQRFLALYTDLVAHGLIGA